MPRYEVTTDQGRYEVTLDREPQSADELNSLVTDWLSQPARRMPNMPSQQDVSAHVTEAAQQHGVPESLLRALIQQESQFNPKAMSPKGAQGLMQLMPATARQLGVQDPYDPRENIQGGTKHFKGLLTKYQGDVSRALAAYNAGEVPVDKHNGVPPFPETQDYVKRILANYQGGNLPMPVAQAQEEAPEPWQGASEVLRDPTSRQPVPPAPGLMQRAWNAVSGAFSQSEPTPVDGLDPSYVAARYPMQTAIGEAAKGGFPLTAMGASPAAKTPPSLGQYIDDIAHVSQGTIGGVIGNSPRILPRRGKPVAAPAAEVVEAAPTPKPQAPTLDQTFEKTWGTTRQGGALSVEDAKKKLWGEPAQGPAHEVPQAGKLVNASSEAAVKEASEQTGLLGKVDEPKRASMTAAEVQAEDSLRALAPEDREVANTWANALKYWWRRVGQTPDTTLRQNHVSSRVHDMAKDAEDYRDSLIVHWRDGLEAALKPVRKQLKTVMRMLDTTNPKLDGVSPEVAQAYTSARAILDEIAESTGLQPGLRLSRYTKVEDETVKSLRQLIVGAGRKISFSGGIDPRSRQAVTGLLADVDPLLKNPELPRDLADFIAHDYLPVVTGKVSRQGHIKGFGGEYEATSRMAPLAEKATRYQFARTLGGNVMSAAVNLTQQLLTLAHGDARSVLGAYGDLFSPRMRQMAADAGIRGALSKGDVDTLAKLSRSKVETIEDLLSRMFQASETMNRLHAYFTGLRVAKRNGMSPEDAQGFAKNFVDKTQFRMSGAGLPPAWSGGALKKTTLQYKGFQLQYAKAIKDLAKEDLGDWGAHVADFGALAKQGDMGGASQALGRLVRDVATGRMAKFWGTGALVFGPEVMTLGLVDTKTDDPVYKQGILPSMGIWLGHQVGLGALPIEDFKSFAFSLPGPTAAMVADLASVAASVATGKQYDLSLDALVTKGNDARGKDPIDWHKTIEKAVRMLPAGISLERARKANMAYNAQDPDVKRIPAVEPGRLLRGETAGLQRAVRQSIGTEPISDTSKYDRPYADTRLGLPGRPATHEALRQLVGAQDPKTQETYDRRNDVRGELQEIDAYARRAAEVLASTGDMESAINSIPEEIRRQAGTSLPGKIRGAYRRAFISPENRQIMEAPRALRGRVRELLEGDE
jgi:hypothetical protein